MASKSRISSQRASLTSTTDDADVLRALISKSRSFNDISVVGAKNEKQIVKYDHEHLSDIRVMLQPWSRGSIFRRARIWWQILIYIALAIVIGALFFRFLPSPAKVNTGAVSQVSAYFNTFLPFLFGIYLNNIFNRWWTMRTVGVSGLNNSVNNMCVILSSHLHGSEFIETKKLMLRYGLLIHELVYRVARKTDDNLQDLVEAGALMAEESGIISELPPGACRPQAVFVWIQLLWDGLLRQKHIPWHAHQVVLRFIAEGRSGVKTIFTHLNTQIPFAYVHLMACLVHFNLLILALQAGMIFAKAVGIITVANRHIEVEHATDTEAISLLVAQFFYLTMVPMLYLGFLELSQEISDPFGTDLNDFPRAQFHSVMQNENESFFRMGETMPPALLPFLLPGEAADTESDTASEHCSSSERSPGGDENV